MKTLVWITSDCFVDCDLNKEIMELVSKEYKIYWYIIFPCEKQRYQIEDFEEYNRLGIEVCFIKNPFRQRDIHSIAFYNSLYKGIMKRHPDVIYINYEKTISFNTLLWRLPKDKVILTAHQGSVHDGFQNKWAWKTIFYFAYKRVDYVNMFTDSQKKLFEQNYHVKKIFRMPLSLKNFGESKAEKKSEITFLSFGSLIASKNIGLLIRAAEELHKRGVKGFKVSINGACTNWAQYESLIEHKDLFDLHIYPIPNDDIADLFSSSHYFVQPYSSVSQSGPTKIAFQYNIPVIASNLPAFVEEIKDGVNGWVFENQNVEALADRMQWCIEHIDKYSTLVERMMEYTKQNYSNEVIAKKMIDMFNYIVDLKK